MDRGLNNKSCNKKIRTCRLEALLVYFVDGTQTACAPGGSKAINLTVDESPNAAYVRTVINVDRCRNTNTSEIVA